MSAWYESLLRRATLWNRRRLHRRTMARMPRYADWSREHDTPGPAEHAALQQRLLALPATPEVALLLVEDVAADIARPLCSSLTGQQYGHWKLHVAPDVARRGGWIELAAREPRIIVHEGPCAPAEALAAAGASAEWVAFVDTAETWREHALLLLVEAAIHFSGCALVYADEDRLDADGLRSDPHFKCDANPELLLSHDCIGRPALWRSAALLERRPFDSAPAGPWRHHLVLRGTEGRPVASIVHVPHVLLHLSAAAADERTACAAAVQAHLARTGQRGQAQAMPGFDGVRVRFELPEPAPHVTLVIPTRNGLSLLRNCVDSILQRTRYPAFDVLIVDNGSDDPDCCAWLKAIATHPQVSVRRDESPFNFAALNNDAIAEQARGEFVGLVNNDIEVISPDWLREMVSLAARPQAGAVGARLWYSDGRLQHGGVILGIGSGAGHAHKRFARDEPGMMGRAQRLQSLSAVTAACLLVRRATYDSVQGMDAQAFPVAFNDVDFCLRLAARGLRNVWTPFAELYHHESVSRGADHRPEKKQRFLRERDRLQQRWPAAIAHDPAYNPNLTLDHENFALATPPRVSLNVPWTESLLPR
jgi:GT2 family glycosyltransferase